MNKDQFKTKLLVLGIGSVLFFSALWLFFPFERIPGHNDLTNYLTKQLTRVEPLKDNSIRNGSQPRSVIYVLGGRQKSLRERYKIASQLYHQRLGTRILVLSRPGITEYDLELYRNLTNDEWSVKQLTQLGVKPGDIEPVSFKKGMFGTLTEAKGLPEIAERRGYKQIILVTSECHTKRTWIAFSKTFRHRNIAISIYAANDPAGLRTLFYEYFKLVLYKDILLPNYSEQKKLAAPNVGQSGFTNQRITGWTSRTKSLPACRQAGYPPFAKGGNFPSLTIFFLSSDRQEGRGDPSDQLRRV